MKFNYVVKVGIKLKTLHPPTPEHVDHRCMLPCPAQLSIGRFRV